MRFSLAIALVWFAGLAQEHPAQPLPFAFSFAAAIMAGRVLICWLYCNTHGLLLAQMLHASSTGALAAFGRFGVNAAGESFWYEVYAAALWVVVVASWRALGRGSAPADPTGSAHKSGSLYCDSVSSFGVMIRASVSGTAHYVMLAAFALMPLLVAKMN